MPVLYQQPVLTLALDSFKDTTIDEGDIRRMWILFTKCKDDIKNGFRLENISWRIWYKKYLNNTSDLFTNEKLYQKSIVNKNMVNSVESNNSSNSFSNIEPIEVIKKCACGEQLASSCSSSLSTPHSEYTCFDSSHHQPKSNINNTTFLKNNKNKSLKQEQEQEQEPKQKEDPKQKEEPKQKQENIIIPEQKQEQKEIKEQEKEQIKEQNIESKISENNGNEKEKEAIIANNKSKNNNTQINNNIPTLEQFYQQQLLLLQQLYIQKQQQLQYQKQQMNVNTEQIYQQQIYLQQWFNQQQQQLLSNCTVYYKRYIQQYIEKQKESLKDQPKEKEEKEVEEENYDEDEDDDYFYSDEDEDDVDDDDEDDDDEEFDNLFDKNHVRNEKINKNDDLFRKVSAPSLKNKLLSRPSLLSAMIKENNYNEYKKTVEIIQKYQEDDQKDSNNIYSIKDYNHNCINSLNKNTRRKRAPSFEDIKNAQQNYKKLIEMHPLYDDSNNQQQETSSNIDVEEYYEKNNNALNTTTNSITNHSLSTLNSQDSHCTAYSNHCHNTVFGSNKTTNSTRSTKSQIGNRASTNNSVNLYMSKRRVIYSN